MQRFLDMLSCIWLVITNKAMVIPIERDRDTMIAIVEAEGSTIEYCRIISIVQDTSTSYISELSKVVYWVFKKNRFFWKADSLGNKVAQSAEELNAEILEEPAQKNL